MNGYGAGGVVGAGVGQLAYTGANTLGLSVLAACLLIAGLVLVRLGAVRRSARADRTVRH